MSAPITIAELKRTNPHGYEELVKLRQMHGLHRGMLTVAKAAESAAHLSTSSARVMFTETKVNLELLEERLGLAPSEYRSPEDEDL